MSLLVYLKSCLCGNWGQVQWRRVTLEFLSKFRFICEECVLSAFRSFLVGVQKVNEIIRHKKHGMTHAATLKIKCTLRFVTPTNAGVVLVSRLGFVWLRSHIIEDHVVFSSLSFWKTQEALRNWLSSAVKPEFYGLYGMLV